MHAGALQHRIIIQSPGGSRDAAGERTTTWTDVATVYASIRGLSTREAMIAGQRQASSSNTIEIRYASTIAAVAPGWRLTFGSRIFTIDGVTNVDEANRTIQLACTEGLRQE